MVLGFLGWAWVSTQTSGGGVDYNFRDSVGQSWTIGFSVGRGQCCLSHFRSEWVGNGFDFVQFPEGYAGPWIQAAMSFESGRGVGRTVHPPDWWLSFAFWFLILLFLAVWSTWLFFHRKREQKKAAS